MAVLISVLKLINNTTLIGEIEYTPAEVVIRYPLEVHTQPLDGQAQGEMNHIRPYLTMTDVTQIEIDQFNILTTYPLSDRFVPSYLALVEQCYGDGVKYDGSFLDDDADWDDEGEWGEEELEGLTDELADSKQSVH